MDTAQVTSSAFAELWEGIKIIKSGLPVKEEPETQDAGLRSAIQWWNDNGLPEPEPPAIWADKD